MGVGLFWTRRDDTPDPAWKPTGIRQVFTGYAYAEAKAFQERKAQERELARQVMAKVTAPRAVLRRVK